MKTSKYSHLLKNYAHAKINYSTLFVRILPTDNCNLNCFYCFQRKSDTTDMSWDLFSEILNKARDLRVGLMSFLGGEPMLWPHLYDALALCSQHNILTDMTTNGTLLNETTIERLGSSGLDALNVSVDTKDNLSSSKKNTLFDNDIVSALKRAEKAHGMKVRMNGVIFNNNFEDIKLLLELSKEKEIPLSLGFIVPDMKDDNCKSSHFTEKDTELLEEIVTYILQKKKEKYPIIDPDSYFSNVFKFIKNEDFWECNYPTRYGWINVTPTGTLRGCTKKMDDIDTTFLSLTPEKIKAYKESLRGPVKECNPFCYSNCAYDSAYYKNNKLAFVSDNFSKTF